MNYIGKLPRSVGMSKVPLDMVYNMQHDVHWISPATLIQIDMVITKIASAPPNMFSVWDLTQFVGPEKRN
jgi:hypothetical protein